MRPGCMLQQRFAITAAVCTQNLQFGRTCLLQVQRDLNLSRITYSQLVEHKFPLLNSCNVPKTRST
ncbi:hypothetical protein VP01_2582g3 [Puccinia sorghi]|uniref:Uncharacterized protein n=1 Tax=Puccinia sorghi TaxID=27349 RepID=A0A0L6V4T9_9BASI|nr:hypothetical protein VP01_2582g3 [Puccinia sorghi]